MSKKSNKLLMLGLAMMATGIQDKQRRPSKREVELASAAMRARWEEDNAKVPVQDRHPEKANFDPLIPAHPTSACGFTIGDRVEIRLFTFQGEGVITGISTVWEECHGTQLYPMFYVRISESVGQWFSAVALFHAE